MAPVYISSAVEGTVDEAVVRRLVEEVGGVPGPVYVKNGKAALRHRIRGFNNAARHAPWIVLVDLNGEEECAPPLRASWLPEAAAQMCFRVAVREVEAWLIADRERIATFIAVRSSEVPVHPESVEDPKAEVVRLARVSRQRDIREDMVPRPGSRRVVGPAYSSRLIEFVSNRERGWRPSVAAQRSESLHRCLACLRRLVQGTR